MIILFLVVLLVGFASSYTPPAGSSLAKGEHPRLHLTQDKLPYFRDKIKNYYFDEYQGYVSWVDSYYGSGYSSKMGIIPDYCALIYLIGDIEGINYGHSINDYGDRAIEIMIETIPAIIAFLLIIFLILT